MIQLVQWDTDNFGFKVGNLVPDADITKEWLDAELLEARNQGYELLYLKGGSIPEELMSENILLADEKVVYQQDIRPSDSHFSDANVVSIKNCELSDELLALAYESGKYSRYNIDKKLPSSVFKTLYRLWMERSLNGTIATDVLGFCQSDCCDGMLTYKKEENCVDIGLIAVNPTVAGRGVGSKIMQTFLSKFEVGTHIEVATQKRNAVACRYYEKNGFEVKSVTNIYHIWLK